MSVYLFKFCAFLLLYFFPWKEFSSDHEIHITVIVITTVVNEWRKYTRFINVFSIRIWFYRYFLLLLLSILRLLHLLLLSQLYLFVVIFLFIIFTCCSSSYISTSFSSSYLCISCCFSFNRQENKPWRMRRACVAERVGVNFRTAMKVAIRITFRTKKKEEKNEFAGREV